LNVWTCQEIGVEQVSESLTPKHLSPFHHFHHLIT
jgi:hypothetical protein